MLHLTHEMLEQSYELLRVTRPFSRWKLPDTDEIVFAVDGSTKRYGLFQEPNKIFISHRNVGTLSRILMVMAHEMIHLHLEQCGHRDDVVHGREFWKLARQVCNHHHWVIKEFM